jgi:MoaA/NifB/PqqE/SkfB family radical SAM enzyme
MMQKNEKIFRLALEANIVNHCNLQCANCDHSASLFKEDFMSLEIFENDLTKMSEIMHVKELKLVGGEPLLHPKIIDFVKIAKHIGISDRVIIITNGILIPQMKDELWDLLDGMWISIYPNIDIKIDNLQEMSNKHNLWIWKKETPQFVRVLIDFENENAKLVKHIYNMCLDAHTYSCHTIHNGRYYKCQPSVYMAKRLSKLNINYDYERDSILIHKNRNLQEEVISFTNSPYPLRSCSFCLGSQGAFVDHRQLTKEDIKNNSSICALNIKQLLNTKYILPDSLFQI